MMTGMDSQFIANLISGISAAAAIASAIVAWRQATGSKEAKAKADEAHKAALAMSDAADRSAKAAEKRANQAEKLLEQMQQIADSLRRPVLELTHAFNGQRPNDYHYKLRNNTQTSVMVLEVKNLDKFTSPELEIPKLPMEVHPGKPVTFYLPHTRRNKSLELRINVSGKEETIFVEIP
ncbi:hypothetical protein [Rothia mucilaginosa]|uniref:hypothetical protein n=1 Tax=Rothia mucilaginosa TaxID=43675 RepID=UPI0026EA888A|nr:hypothetical protein [Rothia mucilaginosa]